MCLAEAYNGLLTLISNLDNRLLAKDAKLDQMTTKLDERDMKLEERDKKLEERYRKLEERDMELKMLNATTVHLRAQLVKAQETALDLSMSASESRGAKVAELYKSKGLPTIAGARFQASPEIVRVLETEANAAVAALFAKLRGRFKSERGFVAAFAPALQEVISAALPVHCPGALERRARVAVDTATREEARPDVFVITGKTVASVLTTSAGVVGDARARNTDLSSDEVVGAALVYGRKLMRAQKLRHRLDVFLFNQQSVTFLQFVRESVYAQVRVTQSPELSWCMDTIAVLLAAITRVWVNDAADLPQVGDICGTMLIGAGGDACVYATTKADLVLKFARGHDVDLRREEDVLNALEDARVPGVPWVPKAVEESTPVDEKVPSTQRSRRAYLFLRPHLQRFSREHLLTRRHATQLLETILCAHAAGYHHGDTRPANILWLPLPDDHDPLVLEPEAQSGRI